MLLYVLHMNYIERTKANFEGLTVLKLQRELGDSPLPVLCSGEAVLLATQTTQ